MKHVSAIIKLVYMLCYQKVKHFSAIIILFACSAMVSGTRRLGLKTESHQKSPLARYSRVTFWPKGRPGGPMAEMDSFQGVEMEAFLRPPAPPQAFVPRGFAKENTLLKIHLFKSVFLISFEDFCKCSLNFANPLHVFHNI